ncbi:MAG TPA: DNA mismatch repair endonuclease MutL [Pyrinomonadaceae bacterium]|nr:DNA mismatch repair endonuclease MutL [Pyrinomonadaceae bacterium]
MSKIRVLADHVANQIAAGEVVERPASVAKELVENSIDAGATRITIEIEAGGRRLLKISDDGEGMVRDDAILAFERHATSKIRAADDLIAIDTLGFRGEALASIASVAKVELTTSTEDAAAATRVAIDGGKMRDVKDAAHPRGTTIAVRELFFNVPARRKFLRAEATETFHVTNMVTHYALAHPEIAFTLVNNGRDALRAVAAKDLRERAYQIFGAQFVENLLAVEGGDRHVAWITGFVSAPRDRRTSRDHQYFFVNHRYVRDQMIGRSLSEGYRSILPYGFYPAALLFIETPLEEVDVNVHPAKTEVRFRRAAAVADAVREAVREALARNDYVPQIPQTPQIQPGKTQTQTASAAILTFTPPQPRIEFAPPPAPPTPVIPFPSGDEIARDIEDMIRVSSVKSVSPLPPVDSAAKLTSAVTPETLSTNIRPLGQLEESFIIATDDEGLLLIDQHVAHERVLFDKYRALEAERRTESQQLLVPETFDLTPAQATVFDQLAPEFEVYGFDLMRLSGRTVAIKAVPADLPPGLARNMLSELLDTVDAEKKTSARDTLRDDIAASLACRAAIKVNMSLTPEKMRWLIDRLLQTSSPTTCPHGRPIILRLARHDILKGFQRI